MITPAGGKSVKSASGSLRSRLTSCARRLNLEPTKWTWTTVVEKLFWAVIVGLFGFLTLKMSLDLLQQYKSQMTTSRLNVMFNKSLKLPTSTICLPLGADELDVRQTPDNSETYLTYREELSNYFNRENMSKSLFIESTWTMENKSLSSALLHIVFTYLSTLENVENVFGTIIVNFSQYHALNVIRELNEWNAALFLEDEMEKLGVSIEELRRKFGAELLSFYSLNVWQRVERSGDILPMSFGSPQVSSVRSHQVCYQILHDNSPLQTKRESIDIDVDRSSLPNRRSDLVGESILIDISARYRVHDNDEGNSDLVIKGNFGVSHEYSISIAAVYRALEVVADVRRCLENTTDSMCRAQCRINLIRNMCNCTPTSWSTTPLAGQSFDLCSSKKYTICLQYAGYDDGGCVDMCLTNCERWRYSFGEKVRELDSWIFNKANKAFVTLRVASFDYPMFIEAWAWTLEDFFGAFGGVLGLWLGLDFMIIIKLLISGAALFFGACVGREKKEKNECDSEKSSNE